MVCSMAIVASTTLNILSAILLVGVGGGYGSTMTVGCLSARAGGSVTSGTSLMSEIVTSVSTTSLMLNLLPKYPLRSYSLKSSASASSLVANNASSIVTTTSAPTTSK